MSRSENTVGDRVVAAVALGVGGVPQEDARERARGEFMGGGRGDARVAKAPKNSKLIVGRWSAI